MKWDNVIKKKWAEIVLLFILFLLLMQIKLTEEQRMAEKSEISPLLTGILSQYAPYGGYYLETVAGVEDDTLLWIKVLEQEYPLLSYAQDVRLVLPEDRCGETENVLVEDWQEEVEKENEKAWEEMAKEEISEQSNDMKDMKQEEKEAPVESMVDTQEKSLFVILKNEGIQRQYIIEDFTELTEFKKRFYTIDPTTEIRDDQLSFSALYEKDLRIDKNTEGPQILIYHTHSQESFVDSVAGDASTSIVGAGEFLAQILQNQYGYQVLHHCGTYDVESRDYAYANAAPAVEQILKQYPSIKVVIDLHRDAVPEDTHLVTNINGVEVAQFMFFNGLSHTREAGDISYLENPYIQDNLAFSFQMKLTADSYYPGLARKVYLKGYRYNMHYCDKSLLIELGAQTNTVQEIMNACIPLAHVLDMVLSGEQVPIVQN